VRFTGIDPTDEPELLVPWLRARWEKLSRSE
jgi:hypothetical protein